MQKRTGLFSLEFICICLLIFLAYCNLTVFYTLYLYLEQIGIAPGWRGFLIGSSSLSTIAFFLFASPYMEARNAPRWAVVGALLLVVCGWSYMYAHSVAAILSVRLLNGAAIYLLSASCMTLLVENIPPERSGQAFSFYSVALLLPYSIVPMAFDAAVPHLPSVAVGYRDMSLFLLPGLLMIHVISRGRRRAGPPAAPAGISFGEMWRNASEPRILVLLILNSLYIVTFSSLFFMAQGLFRSRGFSGVGYYFTIQMVCMMAIRLCGNNLFDSVPKVRLIRTSFVLSAASFLLASHSYGLTGLYASSLIMGVGMGLISPALYGLMFTIAEPRYKAVDSNLMQLSLQIGNFTGPLIGAWLMQRTGYEGLLAGDAGLCLAGVALCFLLTSRRVDRDGLAARA
ncbi:major facilitator superfamily MFS_1 [Desulfovibrio sp. X2]|uniref:MFS transporter n=1 Tax=Desulfovibrio sp. X2 TaxID=941449 RepID=UPI0003588A82|nr:MFS transporter [Desulfovibrio sp. X2]EPR42110.1 major facilitator superfamily MFS_1 [Desulfovibrio sp. X2]